MTNEQELSKKLAEWAGLCWIESSNANYSNPNFPESLDACFKHLVPEALEILAKKGYIPPIMKLFQLWYDELVTLTGDSSNVQQAALALCLVIEKLIDSEKGVIKANKKD